ncbi:MAG: twin-arginine translocase TatA/TatE family subunit [Thermoanaerobacteraceae bacterium]|nr:twin-arginine translocase TatA/TatE family subunit [Thermoanaerobacteraceae bacterium]
MPIGLPELVVILVLALVIFGAGKLSGVGKALGTSIREFKAEVNAEGDGEKKEQQDQVAN